MLVLDPRDFWQPRCNQRRYLITTIIIHQQDDMEYRINHAIQLGKDEVICNNNADRWEYEEDKEEEDDNNNDE